MKNQFTRLIWVCCTYIIILLGSTQSYGQCSADPGCDADVNSTQYATVIADDPFCCNNSWDSICQGAYDALGGPPNSTPGCVGTVCIADPGCDADVNSTQYATVIADDPFCCNNSWDFICQNAYNALGGQPNPDPNCVVEPIFGCTDPLATNYNPSATVDDGSCVYADCIADPGCDADVNSTEYDTVIANDPFCCNTLWDGLCQSAYDALGGQPNPDPNCVVDPIFGCTDPLATNFNPAATVDDGSCVYADCVADPGCDADINSTEYDTVIANDPFCCNTLWDGLCQSAYDALGGQPNPDPNCVVDPIFGCTDPLATNYNPAATVDDGSCVYGDCVADPGCDADVNSTEYDTVIANDPFCCNNSWDSICQNAYDALGGQPNPDPDCIVIPIFGCTDPLATNFNPSATVDDGSCIYDCVADPGCDADVNSSEYTTVIANDPFCCNNSWDSICQSAYDALGGQPNPDPACGTADLSGTVNWNNSCGDRATTVLFYAPGSNTLVATYNTTLAANGTFNITGVDEGTFDIFVKVGGHLQKGFANVSISSGINVLAVGNVTPGDVNNVDGINIDDLTILLSAFGSTTGNPNFNALADLNCDGDVNIDDLTLLIPNFGQSGDTPPLN